MRSPTPSRPSGGPPTQPAPTGGRLFLAQGDRIYKVKDIATLQRWVVEKRVLPNDRLSLDGKTWEVVSAVTELRPFFAVLDQLKQTKRELTDVKKSTTSGGLDAVSIPQRAVSEASLAPQERAIISGIGPAVSTSMLTPSAPDELSALADASRQAVEEAGLAPRAPSTGSSIPRPGERPAGGADSGAIGSFFGDGVLSGEGEPDSAALISGGDFAHTRIPDRSGPIAPQAAAASGFPSGVRDGGSVPIEKAARETRSFPAAGAPSPTLDPSLPAPESVQSRPGASDYDPNQTFHGEELRPPGAGLSFWLMLTALAAALVLGMWYFMLGPGAGSSDEAMAAATAPPVPEPTPAPSPVPPEPTAATPEATPEPPTPAPPQVVPREVPRPVEPPAPRSKPEPKPEPKPAASADELVKAGDRASDRGDFRAAASSYEAALEADAGNVRAAVQLGWARIELGQPGEAVTIFAKATRLRPGSGEAHYGLGLAYQELGQRDKARAEYERVIELEPNGRDAAEVKALLRRLE